MSKTGGGVLLISHLLAEAIAKLKSHPSSSDTPTLDAELLLAHCLTKDRTYLYTWPDISVTKSQSNCYNDLLAKRLDGYPVAYLLGSKSFWTLNLIVTPDVLIPRPETELLVETALAKIETIQKPKILDLGTGSGAIALALASERSDAQIIATDYSRDALKIAQLNTKNCNLESRVTFLHSHWFDNIPNTQFDLIVSNPPYIDPYDPHLSQEIRYEPQQALVAEKNGMQDIESIINNCPAYLKKDSWLILEHGYDQGDKTKKLFTKQGFTQIITINDLGGQQRISLGVSSST